MFIISISPFETAITLLQYSFIVQNVNVKWTISKNFWITLILYLCHCITHIQFLHVASLFYLILLQTIFLLLSFFLSFFLCLFLSLFHSLLAYVIILLIYLNYLWNSFNISSGGYWGKLKRDYGFKILG